MALSRSEDYREPGHSGQAPTEVVPSASAQITKAMKEPWKQKEGGNITHSGTITSDELADTCLTDVVTVLPGELSGILRRS